MPWSKTYAILHSEAIPETPTPGGHRADSTGSSRAGATREADRHAAKGYWGYPDEWLARWGSLLALPPDYIRTNHVYTAVDNGEIVGFYALIHSGDTCLLDHLWVLPERIGTGLGRLLFTHALQQAATLGASRLEWEADPHAVGFYQRMGGRLFGKHISDLEGPLPLMGMDIAPQASS